MSATGKPDGTVPCPACGAAVDPLRAGQVAILDGRFHYFCDAKCKGAFLARGDRPIVRDDVATATPPAVAVRPSAPKDVEPASPATHPEDDEPERDAPRSDSTELPEARESEVPEEPIEEPPPPSSVEARPDAPPLDDASEQVEQPTPWVVLCGATAGLLSVAVRLVAPTLDAAELPLALVAAALTVWTLVEHAGARRRVRVPQVASVALAAAIATWARARALPQAPSAIALAGVGAACALTLDLVVRRAVSVLDRARRRIAEGMPALARVVQDGAVHEVAASEVRAGQQVVIEAGQASPVDGTVVGGEATVTPWPDAPADVVKREGDSIVAGALVAEGSIKVIATWAGQDRAWMRPTHSSAASVEQAAPLVRAARLVAERGAPLAALLAAVASVATGAPIVEALAAAASAGMALGAIGPVAAVALRHARGQLVALKHGVVYKDAIALDRAGQVDVAVACARGTLLLGEPEIVAVEGLGTLGAERLLELVAGAVTGSAHPFAAAVARTARARGARPENVRNAVQVGSGATASLATGEKVVVGRRSFLLGEKVSVAVADARATELESQGRSVLLCAVGGKLVGLLALQDGIKAGARAAVQRLLDARIEPVLLSGEARETCETIGRALDIEHVRPEVASQDRGAEVKALGGGGHVVAVIGHPARDDAALGAADVSVALGAAGAAPGEWAVTLASEDVRDAAFALTIPQQTRERSRVALVVGLAPAVLGALLVGVAGVSWVVAPVLALTGSMAAVLYAKE